jgi:NAD(P)-dependent dehydrogenase (short-subunit alcohol dehydrogenase family)
MTIARRTILVTGANRGIGQPLNHPDPRVTPLSLDVTSTAQAQAAAANVGSLDVLINNAGLAFYDDLTDPAALEQHLAVNLYGTHRVTQAFLPQLTRSGGTIINVLSDTALAALPLIPAYSISKAAAFSLTQSLRALLAPRGIRVHAVIAGPVDTDMSRDLNAPKASPASVARAILDAVDKQEDDIFPDPAQALAHGWHNTPAKALERRNAALVAAEFAKA